jgi:1-pyrroline-5-carboxylate dehydrogenase
MAERMKITYSTMSADNEELQASFDRAFEQVRGEMLGVEVPMFINGERVLAKDKTTAYSPVDTMVHLCTAQRGTGEHAMQAVAAAKAAFPGWAATPWQERVAILRRIADRISDNNFVLSAIMVLEVGKSRLEALGEVEETADLLRYYADAMEKNRGYINELGKMNPNDPSESNFSVLKPYGAWVVISPFNFPMALSGAPIAAALVTGNTVVFKGASTTLYTGWKTAELFADAGLPPGVFNYVSGPGSSVGQALQDNARHRRLDLHRLLRGGDAGGAQRAERPLPAPGDHRDGRQEPDHRLRQGGRDPGGCRRDALGLRAGRAEVLGLFARLCPRQSLRRVRRHAGGEDRGAQGGRPQRAHHLHGHGDRQERLRRLSALHGDGARDGTVLYGGNTITEGKYGRGYYVQPAIIADLGEDHPLVKHELFLPILYVAKVKRQSKKGWRRPTTPTTG